MAVQQAVRQAWLDVPPRRRASIPARDLGAGLGIGVGLCVLLLAIAAGMDDDTPPRPEEPLTVSIGVLASTDARAAGSAGAPGRGGKPGRRRGRKDAASTSTASEPSEPTSTPPHHAHDSSSASALPPPTVPSPWDAPGLPGLPGLGDLGEPSQDTGEGEGGTGGDEGGGDGGGGGGGDGGLGAYRSQLAAWLASHFHVEGSGLGATALRKLRVRAVLELDDSRVVVGYRLTPTGTPAVDEAAKRALEDVKGQPVPAPPPGHGSLQRRINEVLTCRPDTCS